MKSTTLIWATRELTGTTRSSWSSESRFSTEKASRTGLTASLTGDTRHRGEGTYRTGLGLSRALNCRGETWTGDSVIQSFIVYSGLGGGTKTDSEAVVLWKKSVETSHTGQDKYI